eukprot:scaffold24899_cov63-Phaeocystis_antarctica.AAC.2
MPTDAKPGLVAPLSAESEARGSLKSLGSSAPKTRLRSSVLFVGCQEVASPQRSPAVDIPARPGLNVIVMHLSFSVVQHNVGVPRCHKLSGGLTLVGEATVSRARYSMRPGRAKQSAA